jgi:hypothetical protein
MTKPDTHFPTTHRSSGSRSNDVNQQIRRLPDVEPTHGFDNRVIQAMLQARPNAVRPSAQSDRPSTIAGWLGDLVSGWQDGGRAQGQRAMSTGRLSFGLSLLILGLLAYWVYGAYFATPDIDPSDVDLIMMMGYHLY